jgi:hypothetical protein
MQLKLPGTAILGAIALSCAVGFLSALLAGIRPLDETEWRIYDLYLALLPERSSPRDFLVLEPDLKPGDKRWSPRDALQIFRLLEEFEVERLALAGKAFEGGPEGEELAALRTTLPGIVDRECANINENIQALFGAIRLGSVQPKELNRYVEGLAGIVLKSGERIKSASGQEQSQTLLALDAETRRLGVEGAQFSGIEPDPDGRVRRIALVRVEDGRVVPRVELAALIGRLGYPVLKVEPGQVLLRGGKLPGGERKNFAIPVDTAGRALLPWPSPRSKVSPRRLSLASLFDTVQEEEDFIARLGTMQNGGIVIGAGAALLSRYQHSEQLLEAAQTGIDETGLADWREARQAFFSDANAYFTGGYEAELLSTLDANKARAGALPEEMALIDERMEGIKRDYDVARTELARILADRAALAEKLRGSLVFFSPPEAKAALVDGFGGTASPAYAGAVFAGSVLSQSTPRALGASFSLVAALALSLIAAAAILVTGPLAALGLGLGAGALGLGISVLSFAAQGRYLPPLPLLLGPIMAAITAYGLERRRLSATAGAIRQNVAVAAFKNPWLLREIEGMEAGEAARSAQSFLDGLRSSVEAEGGRLAASDGSNILSYFLEIPDREEPRRRALKAVLAAGDVGLRFRSGTGFSAGKEVELRAGLDFGECLVATNLLGSKRKDGAALVGSVADLALRLADLNSHYGSRVLATGSAIDGLGHDGYASRLIGELEAEATKRKSRLYAIEKTERGGEPNEPHA